MKLRIIILILLVFSEYIAQGQVKLHDFPTMRWTQSHGLKHNSVDDLAVDSRGIIWVSTFEGIYRHNGNNFDNLNTLVKNSPFDNPIRSYDLFIDKEDRMWIGTWQNGLMMYDINKNELTHFRSLIDDKDHLSSLRIYGLHTLNDSIFRFTSHTHGLIDYYINQDSFSKIEVFTDSVALNNLDGFQRMIKPVKAANSKRIDNWYICLTAVVQYDEKLDTFIYYDNNSFVTIRDAVMDEDSILWCVTYGQGLFSFDIHTKEFNNYRCQEVEDWEEPCLTGACIEIYNDSTLIMDSSDKLYFFNKNNKSFFRFNDKIPHSQWSGRTQEMEWVNGELWQASWSSTLYRHFPDDHGVASVSAQSYIAEVYYDALHDEYISISHPNLITIHKESEFEEFRVPKELLDEKYVEGVAHDSKGYLWLLSNDQVIKFNHKNQSYSLPFKKVLDQVKSDLSFKKLATNPNGTIWASSHDGTIFTFDPITLEYKFYGGSSKESFHIEYNYRAHLEGFSQDHYTWFSAQNGFFGISPNDNNHKFCKDLKDSKTNQPITVLSPYLGIGYNGKICFGAKTHEVYVVDQDSLNGGYAHLINLSHIVPNLSINDIEIDKNNIIWIATKMGLIQIDQKNDKIELFGDGHRLYDIDDLELKNGIYPIALSHNAFLIIDPARLTPFPGTPNIQLLNAELDAKSIKNKDGSILKTGAKIDLGPNDNFLRIRFNDFNYVSQKPKSYAIKVEGIHDEWIDLKERNEYGFSGLPGGRSNILVKSKLQFSKDYSAPVTLLTVDVTPPLTKRKSFWALCLGILLLLIYLGYRYRLAQLKEKQNLMIAFNKQLAETEMKALRAQMNPHFLFNVLNAIKLNVQKNEQENAIDFITDFSKLIRSVLQNSGKKRISLEEELQTLELYIKIERKRFSTSFDYEFTIDNEITANEITIPPMLLQPYVENAIWHGILHKAKGKGAIKVNTYRSDEDIVVEIIDNGIGRERANQLKLKSAQKNKSMGMQITRDRMAISNIISSDHIDVNIIDLYDNNNQAIGTKVVITLGQNSKNQ